MRRADICIYGATSAGVVAAVAAARLGRSVILVEPGRHVGGMSSGGLGATDFGNKQVIGGIAREFYRRVGAAYGVDERWTFEPGVTERVFRQMLDEADVTVLFGHRIVEADRAGDRIAAIRVEHIPTDDHNAPLDGVGASEAIVAGVYIDCSYEGDAMARAGVRCHVGRERAEAYGETFNGVSAAMEGHQFLVDVDPYVEEGRPESGLMPLIQPGRIEAGGTGDARVQAYNLRLCFTRREANRLDHRCPPDYDPRQFALLARYLHKLQQAGREMRLHRTVMAISPMPNGKTDINNSGPFSTDYIGMNWAYPDADYGTRGAIWRDHLRYTQGLIYFLATDPRVPPSMRQEMNAWGRCRDEFIDTDGWPHQLYVREARRMIGAAVVTQAFCEHRVTTDEPIGMAAYKMDSHNVRRIVVDGFVRNEGNVEVPPAAPFAIPYGAITPAAGECGNLLVPVCLSASHIAYGSVRMEPVFMVLGQSAAIAADLALRQSTSVQTISRAALADALAAAGQVLSHNGAADGAMNEVFVEPETVAAR